MTEVMNVEIAGPVSRIVLPDLCACCGHEPAPERILIERAFQHWYRNEGTFKRWEFTDMRVPFCAICAEKHRLQEVRLSFSGRLLLLFQTWTAIPMLICAALAVRFLQIAAATPGSWFLPFAVSSIFALLGVGAVATGWRNTRHRAIPKPTEVTASFVFSEDRSKVLEPEHRSFTLWNSAFASAFVEANRSRLWNPAGPHAQIARSLRLVGWSLFVGASLLILAWMYLLHH
ncbi:MAG: hypothetical protein WCA21_10130 [Terracidiphilus sp.]|jgi:hypothetical protein